LIEFEFLNHIKLPSKQKKSGITTSKRYSWFKSHSIEW